MPSIIIAGQNLEAKQGPYSLRVWPPGQLQATLRAYRKRRATTDWRERAKEARKANLKASGKGRGKVTMKDKSQWGNLGWE